MEWREGSVTALELGHFEFMHGVAGLGFAVVALSVGVVVNWVIGVLLLDVGGEGAMV